jgi:hypothetical protein
MTELINRKTDVQKRSDARGAPDGAEATPMPQQRAVLERYLKRRDSRPDAPRLSVKSKPNQPLEVSQLQPAGRRPLNRHRGDLNRRSSRLKRIFFEVPLPSSEPACAVCLSAHSPAAASGEVSEQGRLHVAADGRNGISSPQHSLAASAAGHPPG